LSALFKRADPVDRVQGRLYLHIDSSRKAAVCVQDQEEEITSTRQACCFLVAISTNVLWVGENVIKVVLWVGVTKELLWVGAIAVIKNLVAVAVAD
jgi:hypothetical protein